MPTDLEKIKSHKRVTFHLESDFLLEVDSTPEKSIKKSSQKVIRKSSELAFEDLNIRFIKNRAEMRVLSEEIKEARLSYDGHIKKLLNLKSLTKAEVVALKKEIKVCSRDALHNVKAFNKLCLEGEVLMEERGFLLESLLLEGKAVKIKTKRLSAGAQENLKEASRLEDIFSREKDMVTQLKLDNHKLIQENKRLVQMRGEQEKSISKKEVSIQSLIKINKESGLDLEKRSVSAENLKLDLECAISKNADLGAQLIKRESREAVLESYVKWVVEQRVKLQGRVEEFSQEMEGAAQTSFLESYLDLTLKELQDVQKMISGPNINAAQWEQLKRHYELLMRQKKKIKGLIKEVKKNLNKKKNDVLELLNKEGFMPIPPMPPVL